MMILLYLSTTHGFCVFLLWVNGLVVSALGIELRGDPGSIPGSCHYSIGYSNLGQVVYSLQFLSSKKLEYKRKFSAPK